MLELGYGIVVKFGDKIPPIQLDVAAAIGNHRSIARVFIRRREDVVGGGS